MGRTAVVESQGNTIVLTRTGHAIRLTTVALDWYLTGILQTFIVKSAIAGELRTASTPVRWSMSTLPGFAPEPSSPRLSGDRSGMIRPKLS